MTAAKDFSGERNTTYDLEKQKVANRLVAVEEVISETLNFNKKIYMRMYGDPEANPPIKGIEERLHDLEKIEKNREKNKENLIKMILGAVTIAIGSIVWQVFIVLRNAFIHKGP